MRELLAAVISLESEGALPPWSGRGAQAWLLDSIRRVDPALADKLHETGSGSTRRPYTLSVTTSETVGTANSPADRSGSDKASYRNKYLLRITSLSADLTATLGESVLPHLLAEGVIRLNGVAAAIKSIQSDGHPWAGRSSFEQVAQQTLTPIGSPDTPISSLAWEFVTPTAFHQKGLIVPLPLPGLVFGSLIHAWDQFSPLPLPVPVGDFAERYVGISRHRIATRFVKFGKTEQHIGFVGTADYRIVPGHGELSQDEFRQRARLLMLLSQFAFYAGVGIRTTVGMGQVRVALT